MNLNAHQVLNASYEGIVLGVIFSREKSASEKEAPINSRIASKLEEETPKIHFYKAKRACEIGTLVVVPTSEGPAIGEVYSVLDEFALDLSFAGSYKWIIQVIDFAEYEELTGADAALVAEVGKAQRKNIRMQVLSSVRSVGLEPTQLLSSYQEPASVDTRPSE